MTAGLHQRSALPGTAIRLTGIIGHSTAINDLLAELERVSQVDARVLITGESGVGKELVASYIHANSRRAMRPFVTVNCAGIPEGLLESELFGHVKGSFTGAYRDKPGKFEVADTGTLFLDEVGEMTPRMQGLLLRVLETGELQKVGADQITGRVNCRVIAATNRDLLTMVQAGHFREDLYYRLDVIHVQVPPLRHRRGDIRILAEYFVHRLNGELGLSCSCAGDAYEALERYAWPGNVRQLQNVVQRLMINSRTGQITAHDVDLELNGLSSSRQAPAGTELSGTVPPVPPAPLPAASLLPPPDGAPRDRRVAVAHALYQRLLSGQSFWDAVYGPFLRHELTRGDLREVVRLGLEATRGNYRSVVKLFNIDRTQYKRFMNFLRKHDCCLPFRHFR